MNASEVMVQYLASADIGHVFGYPGDPNIEFMAAARQRRLDLKTRPDEPRVTPSARACPSRFAP